MQWSASACKKLVALYAASTWVVTDKQKSAGKVSIAEPDLLPGKEPETIM
jgi:hypothetical protein